MTGQNRRGDLEGVVEYIGAEMDFESGFYNEAYLDRRISARMRRVDADSYRSYRRLLERDSEERAALLDALSVNVTGFFRNPKAWERLEPVLAELSERRRVRVWSTPCADGREPYSLAILALDHDDVDASRVEVLGTDINDDVLATAREGVYEASKTTDIAAELEPLSDPDRYVDRRGDTFAVRERVKRLVDFERHDLIHGRSKSGFDLVLCRNLLIYIDPGYKTPIFRTIRESLREEGYLVIGMTETLPADCREAFEPVDKRRRIYRHG